MGVAVHDPHPNIKNPKKVTCVKDAEGGGWKSNAIHKGLLRFSRDSGMIYEK
jgi:hypothetical protein